MIAPATLLGMTSLDPDMSNRGGGYQMLDALRSAANFNPRVYL
jgi:hypothetical protein